MRPALSTHRNRRSQVADNYLGQLSKKAAAEEGLEWLPNALTYFSTNNTRAYYFNGQESYHQNAESVIQIAAADIDSRSHAVCVVENIGPDWIETLGSSWDIDPDFFLNHARNPRKEELWDHVFKFGPRDFDMERQENEPYCNIDGVFEYKDWETTEGTQPSSAPNFIKRHCWEGPKPWPLSSNTRISYYRINQSLYLFLVDAPIILSRYCVPSRPRPRPILRLPLSTSWGGVVLPSLFEDLTYAFSLFDCLKSVFYHNWHFRILFSDQISTSSILRPGGLIYLISASLWNTNLRFLQDEIKRISFNDILKPTVHTNEELHYNRRDLVILRDEINQTLEYIPKDVVEWYESIFTAHPNIWIRTPSKTLERILVDEEKLSQFLMDSFQLLLSTLSTRDSQTSLEQATRGQRLTQLAFIYVPLSFVTGIYGMNLKEINDSPVSAWVTVVSALIVVGSTLCVFWLLKSLEKHNAQKVVLQAGREPIRPGLTQGKIIHSTSETKLRSAEAVHSANFTRESIEISSV